MSDERCAISWKAAALADGRLEGADGASFELHAAGCADCRAEKKAVASLYTRMRREPGPGLPPLARARKRSELLARANDRFVAAPPRFGRARWVAVALLAVVAGLAFAVTHPRKTTSAEVVAEPLIPPRYEVSEGAHAIWRARSYGGSARVDLADGTAHFQVDPLLPEQQLVVALPDGDLAATGGRFTVDVALGRIKAVSVSEGAVVLHRSEMHDIVLRAGEKWTRTDAIAAPSAEPSASAASKPAPIASAVRHRGATRPLPPPAPASSSRIAGARFDEAVSSFVSGAYDRADAQLAEFAREFPEDTRCEDASFLGAVARWRLHDREGARSRAEAYLRAYPNGLRRNEAQHIVDDAR